MNRSMLQKDAILILVWVPCKKFIGFEEKSEQKMVYSFLIILEQAIHRQFGRFI